MGRRGDVKHKLYPYQLPWALSENKKQGVMIKYLFTNIIFKIQSDK